jgi:hypothetical protein
MSIRTGDSQLDLEIELTDLIEEFGLEEVLVVLARLVQESKQNVAAYFVRKAANTVE